MKKIVLINFFVLSISTISIQAQECVDKFEIKKSIMASGKNYVTYEEIINESPTTKPPSDSLGNIVNILNQKLISKITLDSIENDIFSFEEINELTNYICFAIVIVSSNGDIVKVTFVFTGIDPDIDCEKLWNYAQKIKQKIKLKFVFDREVHQIGNYSLSFRVFLSVNHQQN